VRQQSSPADPYITNPYPNPNFVQLFNGQVAAGVQMVTPLPAYQFVVAPAAVTPAPQPAAATSAPQTEETQEVEVTRKKTKVIKINFNFNDKDKSNEEKS
jgi:hypothetical protein